MAAPFSTPFQILFFFSLCAQPFIQFSHHLTIRLFAICTLWPQGHLPLASSFSFLEGPSFSLAIWTLVSPSDQVENFKERGKKKQLPPYIFNHLLTFPLFSQYVFPKLLIKMASTWPTPLYFLSIQRVVKKTWAIRQKETSPYFILADLCRGFKNIKKTPLICVENAELRGKSQN